MFAKLKVSSQIAFVLMIVGVFMSMAIAADAPQTIDLEAGCLAGECHSDIGKLEFLHGPSNMGQCEPCHVPLGNRHAFEESLEGSELCLTCHEAEEEKEFVHVPYSIDCMMCHDPHGADNKIYLIGGAGADLCNRCHTDVSEGMERLHGPVALGECLVCHTPHQSDFEGLLVEAPPGLCISCHTDFGEKLEGAVSVHEPVRGDCTGCHNPHGANKEFFVEATGKELCQTCHGEFLANVDKFTHPHKPMLEGKSCNKCHDMHASNQVKLLASDVKDLCLSCHNEEIISGDRTIANIQAQLDMSEYKHGPIRQGNCVACHDAHGSDFNNILSKAFPTSFYTSFTPEKYELCFDCHDRKQVMSEQSMDTGFRNGNENLHYLHTHRDKGRSCRACHHEHASNQPRQIREEVPFGRWNMKVEYEMTETGGGCETGCHKMYKYDRVTAVDNQIEE